MSAWSVKTRRAPSRHCRDARVYGHTSAAMHHMSTPSSAPSLHYGARLPPFLWRGEFQYFLPSSIRVESCIHNAAYLFSLHRWSEWRRFFLGKGSFVFVLGILGLKMRVHWMLDSYFCRKKVALRTVPYIPSLFDVRYLSWSIFLIYVEQFCTLDRSRSVSYTHLTLPTIYSV